MEGFIIILLTIFLLVIYLSALKNKRYKESAYYQITKNPYSFIKYDKGKYTEYLTYKSLRHFENNGGKFLFNIFIPKPNNKMTEIDILLICPKGLFVFECKNYGGWIFGNEVQKQWTQTLPKGRRRCHKEHFYNPIMQNMTHIKYLKNLIGKNIPIQSIIVFSDRCILKKVIVKSRDIRVINLKSIATTVSQICDQIGADIYTETEINGMYKKLFPYTQFNDEVKEQHIENFM